MWVGRLASPHQKLQGCSGRKCFAWLCGLREARPALGSYPLVRPVMRSVVGLGVFGGEG